MNQTYTHCPHLTPGSRKGPPPVGVVAVKIYGLIGSALTVDAKARTTIAACSACCARVLAMLEGSAPS